MDKKPIEILAEVILPNQQHARDLFMNNPDIYSPHTNKVIEAMKIAMKQAFIGHRNDIVERLQNISNNYKVINGNYIIYKHELDLQIEELQCFVEERFDEWFNKLEEKK